MRLLPQSLFGRLLLFLTGGLVVAQLLSAAILLQELRRDLQERYRCQLSVDDGLLEVLASEAERSGRYAHAVSDIIGREIRLPAVDIVTKTDKKSRLRVTLEKNKVRVVAVP